MGIELGAMGRSFLAWWVGELASLLPGFVRRMLLGGNDQLEVVLEEGHLALELFSEGEIRRSSKLPWPSPAPDRTARRTVSSHLRAADEVVLRLPAGQVLRTTLDLPLSAGGAIEEAVADAIGRRTPFGPGEVHWDWRALSSDIELERLYVDVLIARRRDISNALAAIGSLGIVPGRIDGPRHGREEERRPFNLLPQEALRHGRAWRERLVRPLAYATLALAIGWGALALERRESELEALQDRLASLRGENEVVSAMEDRFNRMAEVRSFLGEKKRTTTPFVEILADVTRRIPDGDWLYGYSVTMDNVSMQGLSRDASILPRLLEHSEYLGEVSFAAPVRRNAQDGIEDFTITAKLGRAP